MAILLLIFSILAFMAGCGLSIMTLISNGALVGVQALICFLASAIFFVGCAIVGAIDELRKSKRIQQAGSLRYG